MPLCIPLQSEETTAKEIVKLLEAAENDYQVHVYTCMYKYGSLVDGLLCILFLVCYQW